ncbi:SusC/RagA family TonB-linked outer membrane protein [Mucilaginibacter sp. SP1R1]|uniref:SusC/RagA family TonB-linked outer membrane protein n=1 Tax=Mucilaginibacter sp. SP1R1 TaxID=2723091 RepID=UPI00180A65C2|nr:TonB-dependent receptor [Mucilaginibacter sp. SP1R1]MBB6148334.1 TonB-linked SusC/RagA family outer membrane protein [Mucilaginibacter sp. SP1R1]
MKKDLHVVDGVAPLDLKSDVYLHRLFRLKNILPMLGILLLLNCTAAFAQMRKITGTIKDENQQPLPGVTVAIKGTTIGMVTDAAGNYSLNIPEGNNTVSFSFIGYVTQEVVIGKQTSISVSLAPSGRNLNEVVVVGYGAQKKSDVTGAISSLSPKDFRDQPVNRLDQALQGRVSGVEVANNSGAPGGEVTIRIRGSNSILGNNNPLYVIDGFVGEDFNNLSTSDIASIQVLKDASSTAIYGSRGANGVVLITTKRGSSNNPEITFSSTVSSARVLKKLDLLGAFDFANTVNARDAAINANPTYTADQIAGYKANGGTDWQNEIFHTAPSQEYNLGITNGNAKTNYFLSANYLSQDGIVLNSGYKRYSIRSNINSKINDKLAVRLNISGVRRENLNSNNSGRGAPVNQAYAWAPTTPVRDAKGNYTISDPVSSIFANPVALANDQTNTDHNTFANVIGGASYQFFSDLSLDVTLAADYQNYQGAAFSNASITNNVPTAGRTSLENINLQNTSTLTYKHVFHEDHSLTVTAVYEQQKSNASGFSANATNLTFPGLGSDNLSLSGTQAASASYSNTGIVSYLGRLNYAYKDKYLLTTSVRRDESSKFQGVNKAAVFPSVALGWKLSEEPFIKKLNTFDVLKVRASWGLTGSQAVGPYSTLATYTNDNYAAGTSFNNNSLTSGINLGNAANPDLKWETTNSKDVGLEMSIFNGRLNFDFDYYVKNTRDLLLSLPLPAYAGGGSIVSNVGKVKNSGTEFSLSVIPVRTEKFSWSSSFNITFSKNLVQNIGNLGQIFPYTGFSGTQPEFIIKPGYSLGSYWGLNYLGTWKPSEAAEAAKYGNKPGDSHYQDMNGDHAINADDYKIIGNGTPNKMLGWNNTFTYSNFTLNLFVQSLFGFKKLDYTYANAISANADTREVTSADILNRYIPGVNETSNIPAFSTTNQNFVQSTRFLENGNFVRIKNINLSYELPKNTIKNVGVKVFIGAINLFTITKYKGLDPETSNANSGSDVIQSVDYGAYPNSKIFNAGVTLKF